MSPPSGQPPLPRWDLGEAGFTVIELVVTMLLLSIALAIAAGLLVEAVRVYSATGRELREPATELTFRMLREDIRAAAPRPVSSGGTGDPLVLVRESGAQSWNLEGERLERTSFDVDGNDLGARPMLDKVLFFRWRVIPRGRVEVEIVRRRPEFGSALRAATSAWRNHGEILETVTIVVGSRISPPESEE